MAPGLRKTLRGVVQCVEGNSTRKYMYSHFPVLVIDILCSDECAAVYGSQWVNMIVLTLLAPAPTVFVIPGGWRCEVSDGVIMGVWMSNGTR
jgi:hypothetical protein